MSSRFASLEEVVRDPLFPEVDLALRRGRHIDRDDGDSYVFLSDAQAQLEQLYRRYGCELVMQTDGYFYLLPSGDKIARRHLNAGEMLVGQTLALQALDPTTIQTGGVITRDQLLARLGSLVSDRDLARALEPRRRRFDDERVVHETIRKRVAEAVRRLVALGFVDLLDDEHLRLRSALFRFAGPVRTREDLPSALQRLIASGEAVEEVQSIEHDGNEALAVEADDVSVEDDDEQYEEDTETRE
jgi:chromosome partition protein MukE